MQDLEMLEDTLEKAKKVLKKIKLGDGSLEDLNAILADFDAQIEKMKEDDEKLKQQQTTTKRKLGNLRQALTDQEKKNGLKADF